MCHNSVFENEQIEKCIENGMPEKLIKTIKYTMRKRANDSHNKNQKIKQQQQQKKQEQKQKEIENMIKEIPPQQQQQQQTTFISKCPFGHGKLSTPSSTPLVSTFFTTAASTNTTTTTTNITQNLNISLNNNNNIFLKHFPQIYQLSTKITEKYVDMSKSNNNSGQCNKDNEIYNDDILAKSTQLTREFAQTMQQAIRGLQNSKIYT